MNRKSRFRVNLLQRTSPATWKEQEAKKDEETREEARGRSNVKQQSDDQLFSDSDGEEDGGETSSKNKNHPSEMLKIRKVKSAKDKISNPHLSEQDLIPRLGTSSIMNGTTGQGKSTLLTNLISSKRFFGGKNGKGEDVFKFKFLVSPTAEGDDVQKKLGVEEEDTFTDLDEAPELIEVILDKQKEDVIELGSDKAPQVLMVYDDVISHPKFMRTDPFIKSFIASRHYNLTTFICSQSWTSVPRRCRLQAKNIFFFASPLSEVELLSQEYCPPGMTKKQFFKMVDYCTSDPYSFMYINKSVPMDKRFRKRLDEMINIKYFQSLNITRENELLANEGGQPGAQERKQEDPSVRGLDKGIGKEIENGSHNPHDYSSYNTRKRNREEENENPQQWT